MAAEPAVTVIALFDRGDLEPCLSSLLAQEGVDFEIIGVVPAGFSSPTGLDPRVTLVPVEDRNPARRRNLAAAKARGRHLAFIDDDAAAPLGWLSRAVAFLEANSGYAGVGGPNLMPFNSGFLEQVTDMLLSAPLIGSGSRAYRGGGELKDARPGELHLVNLAVRKEWFDKIGGLNPALGYGGEDTEFLHRALGQGARFAFDPGLIVQHRRRPFGPAYFRQRFRLRGQSARLFAAEPEIYAGNLSFLLALIFPPAAMAAAIFLILTKSLTLIVGMLIFYAALTLALSYRSWRSKPALLFPAPLAFALHHLVYVSGLWSGLLGSLVRGLSRTRNEIRTGRNSAH